MPDWIDEVYADVLTPKSPLKAFLEENLDRESKLKTIDSYYAFRQTRKYDCIIGVTGDEGRGKSHLMIEQGEDIAHINNLPFDYEKNIIYNPTYAEIIRIITTIPEKSPVIIDEAIKTMYARNWNKKEQKEMNTIFATIRKRKLAVFLGIPSMAELDGFFKNIRLLAWEHIFQRSKVGIFVKDPNPFNTDPFNLKLSKKIIEEGMGRDRFSVDNMILKLKQNVPNFITNFKFEPLSPKKEAKYESLAIKYITEIPQEEEAAKGKLKTMEENFIVELYQASPQWSYEKLAKKFNISENKVRTIIQNARTETKKKEEAISNEPERNTV